MLGLELGLGTQYTYRVVGWDQTQVLFFLIAYIKHPTSSLFQLAVLGGRVCARTRRHKAGSLMLDCDLVLNLLPNGIF